MRAFEYGLLFEESQLFDGGALADHHDGVDAVREYENKTQKIEENGQQDGAGKPVPWETVHTGAYESSHEETRTRDPQSWQHHVPKRKRSSIENLLRYRAQREKNYRDKCDPNTHAMSFLDYYNPNSPIRVVTLISIKTHRE